MDLCLRFKDLPTCAISCGPATRFWVRVPRLALLTLLSTLFARFERRVAAVVGCVAVVETVAAWSWVRLRVDLARLAGAVAADADGVFCLLRAI
jgi:hypothetical protein